MMKSKAPIDAEAVLALGRVARAMRDPTCERFPASLIVMSDRARLPDLEQVIKRLPKGSAIIFRDYFDPERELIAKRLRGVSRRHDVLFLVAGDPVLARSVDADGLHIPSRMLAGAGRWSGYKGITTAACHHAQDLNNAHRLNVDAVLISPVYPTRSHPGAHCLGAAGFLGLARRAQMPVFALGGVGHNNARRLGGKNVAGIAAIDAFVS